METCTSLGGQIQDATFVVTDFDGDDFVGQAFQFLAAGFETSGSTMCFALYELALHSDIQTRLRAEIMQNLNKHNGQLTYEGIQEMAYLDMVVSGEGTEAGCIVCRTFDGKLVPSICNFRAEMSQTLIQNSLFSNPANGKNQFSCYLKSKNTLSLSVLHLDC